jgi:hypothetical protein
MWHVTNAMKIFAIRPGQEFVPRAPHPKCQTFIFSFKTPLSHSRTHHFFFLLKHLSLTLAHTTEKSHTPQKKKKSKAFSLFHTQIHKEKGKAQTQ